jgi:hypothetical protein
MARKSGAERRKELIEAALRLRLQSRPARTGPALVALRCAARSSRRMMRWPIWRSSGRTRTFIPARITPRLLKIDPSEYETAALAEARWPISPRSRPRPQLEAERENLTARPCARTRAAGAGRAGPGTHRAACRARHRPAGAPRRAAARHARLPAHRAGAGEHAFAAARAAGTAGGADGAHAKPHRPRRARSGPDAGGALRHARDGNQVEAFQFVNAGQPLLTGEGIERAEIVAQIPVEAFRRIVRRRPRHRHARPARPDACGRHLGGGRRGPSWWALTSTWPARVEQVQAGLDARTRTVQVVLSVDAPYDFGETACRWSRTCISGVELTGPPLRRASCCPMPPCMAKGCWSWAADDRLELRAVEVAFRQHGQTVLRDGVAPGERVVLTDVVPAIAGTLLRVAGTTPAP